MDFINLDLGSSKPTVVSHDVIHVIIDPTLIVSGYAKAICDEAERMNPLTFEKNPLSEAELDEYFRFLLYQRVCSVTGECPLWRKLKNLYIPTFLQFAIAMVGRVDLRDRGLTLVPQMEKPAFSFEQALDVSEKLSYHSDVLAMVKDAMPRSEEGDIDTMSSALIAGYIVSLSPVEHPIATYCAAFLGFKIKEEQAMSVLYRVSYDDVEYIRQALLHSTEVRGRNA